MKRKKVYKMIDEERDYQDSLCKDTFRHSESDRSVPAELLMLKVYIDKASEDWTKNHGDIPALHQVRKIAALAVRCLENHGVESLRRKVELLHRKKEK